MKPDELNRLNESSASSQDGDGDAIMEDMNDSSSCLKENKTSTLDYEALFSKEQIMEKIDG